MFFLMALIYTAAEIDCPVLQLPSASGAEAPAVKKILKKKMLGRLVSPNCRCPGSI